MANRRYFVKIILLVLVLLVFACSTDSDMFPPVSTSPRSSGEPAVTLASAQYSASQISPTDVPQIGPTRTFAPTYSPEETIEVLESLLDDNAGCEYPCWWGITPGKTTIEKARDLFRTLSVDGKRRVYGDVTLFSYRVELANLNQGIDWIEVILRTNREERLVEEIHVSGLQYQLMVLFENFGKPDEIWFYGNQPTPTSPQVTEYIIWYYYSERGVVASYSRTGYIREAGICPNFTSIENKEYANFIFLDPERSTKFEDIRTPFYPPSSDLPSLTSESSLLQKISEYSVDTYFYQFSQPNPGCLRVFNWPVP